MSEENKYVIVLREPIERKYSAKRFFEKPADMYRCMLSPDFDVRYKDILIGIKTEDISNIYSVAMNFTVVNLFGESVPIAQLKWLNAWEVALDNEYTFNWISSGRGGFSEEIITK